MGYHIKIWKVEEKFVEHRDYVGEEDEQANDGSYHKYDKKEDVETVIYTQRVEDIDLKKVIDAVNAKDE